MSQPVMYGKKDTRTGKKVICMKNRYWRIIPFVQAKEDSENYIEKSNLALWLGTIFVTKAESYTLEQLRQAKEILS